MLIIGEKEVDQQNVSIRRQGSGDQGASTLDEFIALLHSNL